MKKNIFSIKRCLIIILAFAFYLPLVANAQHKVETDPKIYLNIARYHMAVDEYIKAINYYDTYFSLNPDDDNAYLEYSHALFWSGRIKECLKTLEKFLKKNGRKTEYLLEYATVLSFSDRFDKAIDVYNEILEKNPSNFSAHLGLSFIYLRSASESGLDKKYRDRIKDLKEKFKFHLKKDLNEAQKISDRLKYEKTYAKGLDRDQILLELAYLKRSIGKYEESVAYFKEYLRRNNDPEVRIELARTYNWAKDLPNAVKELKTVLKQDKNNTRAMKELALYESWLGRHESAESRYVYLLSKDPQNMDLKLRRADNLRWAGKSDKAFPIYKEILDENPSNKEAKDGLLRTAKLSYLHEMAKADGLRKDIVLSIHRIHIKNKNYDADINLLSRYLASNPKDIVILEELGKSYSYKADSTKAGVICEKILKLDKTNPWALENLPVFYLWAEKYDDSIRAFKNLEARRGLNLEQRLQFAKVLKKAGKTELASSHYLLILKSYPNNQEAKDSLIEIGDKKFLEALFKNDPKNRVLTQRLSDQYLAKEDYNDALRVLRRHIEHDPKDYDARLTLARALSWRRDYNESIRTYDELISEKDFGYKDLASAEAAEVISWKGDYAHAEKRFADILKNNPENLDALIGLSKVYLWNGQRPEEIKTYKRILEVSPVNMYAIKMLERAENHPTYRIPGLEAKLRKKPNDVKTMRELLSLYESIEDYDKALIVAEALYAKDPDNKETGDKVEALKKKSSQNTQKLGIQYREEIAKKPFSREPRKKYIAYLIAEGKNNAAIKEMHNYLLLYPEDSDTREDLAEVLSWEGRYAESQNEYETLMLSNPANLDYKVSLAKVLAWSGPENYPLALDLTSDVISKNPEHKEAYLLRGDIYSWSESYNKALKDYRTVLSIQRTNFEAQKGIDNILKPKYSIDLLFLYKADNDDFSQISGGVDIGVFWLKRLNSKFSYSHSLYQKDLNPDVNSDNFRFTQGVRLIDPLYLEAFIGYNRYNVANNTVDYGASLKYNFGLRNFARLGYEKVDIFSDAFTYGSIAPNVIDSDYILFDMLLHPTKRTTLEFDTKFGFFSDTNRYFHINTVLSYLLKKSQPLLSLYGAVKYLSFSKRLFTPARYWDPPYYISIVPGIYMEIDLTRTITCFLDFRIGYGNEDGSSQLELGVDSGFLFRLASYATLRLEGFYGQTGRSLGSQNYYFYGARALLSFGF